jgi:hypothetical protein
MIQTINNGYVPKIDNIAIVKYLDNNNQVYGYSIGIIKELDNRRYPYSTRTILMTIIMSTINSNIGQTYNYRAEDLQLFTSEINLECNGEDPK